MVYSSELCIIAGWIQHHSTKDLTTDENQTTKRPGLLRRIIKFGGKFIDYKIGFIGATVMGTIVFIINFYGTQLWLGSITAALKQGTYTLLFGGSIMKLCEYLATEIKKESVALITAVVIPSIVSIGLTYGVHMMKGTPKPIASTLPAVFLTIPSTAIWGYVKRKDRVKNKI